MALLQFGTTLVFAVPPLWQNPNQPDPNLRKAQAIIGKNSVICCYLLLFAVICCQLHPSYHVFCHLLLLVCHHYSRIKYTVDASSVSFYLQSSIYFLQFFKLDLFLALVSYSTSS
jgi:hypothetical protein